MLQFCNIKYCPSDWLAGENELLQVGGGGGGAMVRFALIVFTGVQMILEVYEK